MVEAFAGLSSAPELGLKSGDPVLEAWPRLDSRVKTIADIAQGHSLSLGAALFIGTKQVPVAVRPDRLRRLAPLGPLLHCGNADLLLDFIAPQRNIGGSGQQLDALYLPAELLGFGIDGFKHASRG